MAGKIKVTLYRSVIGCTEKQKAIVAALGLKRRGRSRVLPDNPATRGAVAKVPHLVKWEEA
ncbi:MAG TPA: 50S ribosomal protein L30 [Deltaproteobacteria bacterium]|nr:50S ribosomal protein L30 [Deltaproteobacteria bacterium]HOM29610.1 50S ribosomal protein L30 [Deltaproteobacteria bacterium]HPP81812.1 50S ribosomal protein L30 [Deltaproteobacteria bacterium]